MLIGYARILKAEGSRSFDLQRDALIDAEVSAEAIHEGQISRKCGARLGLDACLKALRGGDVLVVWKLDRLGRDLRHLVNVVQDLTERGIGLCVLAGQGAQIDTTSPGGRLVFGIFAALAEFERELTRERTVAGLAAARARGRKGGRKFALNKAHVRLTQAAMANRDTSVAELAAKLGVKPVRLYRRSTALPLYRSTALPLYRSVGLEGDLRRNGKRGFGARGVISRPPATAPFSPAGSRAALKATDVPGPWRSAAT